MKFKALIICGICENPIEANDEYAETHPLTTHKGTYSKQLCMDCYESKKHEKYGWTISGIHTLGANGEAL